MLIAIISSTNIVPNRIKRDFCSLFAHHLVIKISFNVLYMYTVYSKRAIILRQNIPKDAPGRRFRNVQF